MLEGEDAANVALCPCVRVLVIAADNQKQLATENTENTEGSCPEKGRPQIAWGGSPR